MWKRGWEPFSTSTTCSPRSARRVAAVDPAGPPPITSTSQFVAAAPGRDRESTDT